LQSIKIQSKLKYGIFIIICVVNCVFCSPASAQKRYIVLKGFITDESNKPIDYVTVRLRNTEQVSYTNSSGGFTFLVDSLRYRSLRLTVGMVGKVTVDTLLNSTAYSRSINIKLKDLNLNLDEVKVNAERKLTGLSNSSIVFDRQAIEQAQAFSLTDILNNLPGKVYAPLDVQGVKSLTLRTEASGNAATNNSLGISILVDGFAENNNGNMQNKDIGKYGLAGSVIGDSKNGRSYETTFGGVDLRDIPADNIESIEVIQGVAPAQYGDLTDGAVIINRQAGKTDYQFSSRFNGGTTNLSLSKGFKLKDKLGAVNASLNYLISNDNPRDRLKQYDRLNANLMWTSYLFKNFKNTLSLDFSEKFDDAKSDPDDGQDRMTYSKNTRLGISNRSSLEFDEGIVRRLNLGFRASVTDQESYTQYYLNGDPKAMAIKDTTGIYEGFYTQGTYTAIDHVVGRPISLDGNIGLLNEFSTGNLNHLLTIGGNVSISSNKGEGVLVDPDRPRRPGQDNKNERPYDFELVPNLVNVGVYIEDKFKFSLFSRNFNVSAGLRWDAQNGAGNLQPRINANYEINKDLRFNLAYGIATKSPTLAHRYPSPTYFDVQLINHYTGDSRTSLLLVHTEKITPDNSRLRSSQSSQIELGLTLNKKKFNTSIFTYYKNNKNGFNGQEIYRPMLLPEYKIIPATGQKPGYYATGEMIWYSGLKSTEVTNNVTSENLGVEWLLSTKKIKEIQSSFNFNTAFNYSTSYNSGYLIRQAALEDILADRKAWYGIYKAGRSTNYSVKSRLNSITHIPKLGFVVNMILDMVWEDYFKSHNNNTYPYAYMDKYYSRYEIEQFDPSSSDYGHLKPIGAEESEGKLPFSYANLSMSLSKEVKKRIRFSVNAYNVLNLQPTYYDAIAAKRRTYTTPISIGAEITIKF
jgi:ferric enterobactin receptor